MDKILDPRLCTHTVISAVEMFFIIPGPCPHDRFNQVLEVRVQLQLQQELIVPC